MEDINKKLLENSKKSNKNTIPQKNIITQSSNSNDINEKINKKIIIKISELLTNICEENTKDIKNEINSVIKNFVSKNIPTISIKDYLDRLCNYSKINSSTILLIIIYIDRLCNIYKFKLSYYNIHKLILSSMLIAVKYNEDERYSIKFYAKLGGITKTELCFLEYNFISLLDFNLFISEELYKKYDDYASSADNEEDEDDYNDSDYDD